MNLSASNTTLLSCGFEFLPLNPTNISPDVYAALVVKITIDIFICPFTILLNILVMIAVKTKRQLRTKSNIALACLATTDFIVGLVLQPLKIAFYTALILKGGEIPSILSILSEVTVVVSLTCLLASLYHLFVMSGERYLAMKHSLAYETGLVTEARIIIASGLAWVGAVIILPIDYISQANRQFMLALTVFVTLFVFIPTMIYFHVTVYKEVRRNKKQIIANQVSLEAKVKLLRNKKSFYTTIIVLVAIFLCYIPANVWFAILAVLKDRVPANVRHIVLNLTTSLPALNSLLNPLIYAVRIRYFRVAFIHLLSRKTLVQAEELEKRIFGSTQIRVGATIGQQQNRVGQEEDVQQADESGIEQ